MTNPLELLLSTPDDPSPDYVWATVTSVDPLGIRLDGDVNPLAGSPASIIDPATLAVNSRVLILQQRRRRIVIGRSGGTPALPPVTPELPPATPFTSLTVNSGSGMCQWRRVGDLIHFQFDVTRSSSMSGDFMWDPLCTLPPEARPATTIAISAWGGSVRIASSAVRSDGTVTWRQQSPTSTDRAVGEGLWPSI